MADEWSVSLEYRLGNSMKFWSVSLWREVGKAWFGLDFNWGRIGTSGQKLTKTFATQRLAEEFARAKIDEKLAKGYAVTFIGDELPPLIASTLGVWESVASGPLWPDQFVNQSEMNRRAGPTNSIPVPVQARWSAPTLDEDRWVKLDPKTLKPTAKPAKVNELTPRKRAIDLDD